MGQNKYIGKWTEPVLKNITLDFTPENAKKVIQFGIKEDESFTHKDIVDWCYKFWQEYNDLDNQKDIKHIIALMEDIDAQWDLNLSNSYSFEELKEIDFTKVRLPREWFKTWADRLEA